MHVPTILFLMQASRHVSLTAECTVFNNEGCGQYLGVVSALLYTPTEHTTRGEESEEGHTHTHTHTQ